MNTNFVVGFVRFNKCVFTKYKILLYILCPFSIGLDNYCCFYNFVSSVFLHEKITDFLLLIWFYSYVVGAFPRCWQWQTAFAMYFLMFFFYNTQLCLNQFENTRISYFNFIIYVIKARAVNLHSLCRSRLFNINAICGRLSCKTKSIYVWIHNLTIHTIWLYIHFIYLWIYRYVYDWHVLI